MYFTCEIMHKFAVHILESLIARPLDTVQLPLAEAEAEHRGPSKTLKARLEDPEVTVGSGIIQRLLPREAGDGGGLGSWVRESRLVEDVHGGQRDKGPHTQVIAHSQTAQLGNIL